jgi:hypothetical protein
MAIGLILVAACAQDAPDTLDEGITVLHAGDGALTVAYLRDDTPVYLEAVRGARSPRVYEGDVTHEVDARLRTADGHVIWLQRAGDSFIDPSWSTEHDAQVSSDSNELLFDLAAEATAVLDRGIVAQAGEAMLSELGPELDALRAIGAAAPTVYRELRERAYADRHRDSEVLANVSLGGGYYSIALYAGQINFLVGYHSATRLQKWNGSAWATIYDFCNHGSCPSSSSLSHRGYLQYYESLEDLKSPWTAQSCATTYDVHSNSGTHNCHDDSRVQMANFVYSNSNTGYQAWCNDGDHAADISVSPGDQAGYPSANGMKLTGYHHPSWCQYDANGGNCPAAYQGDGYCDCGCRFPDGTSADPDCKNK